MNDDASPLELDAILFSRAIRAGERVFVGANLPAARAGALLAALTHARSVQLVQALAWVDLSIDDELTPMHPGMDLRDAEPAEAYIRDFEVFDDVRRLSSIFVIGGLEIDRFGNSNLIGEPSASGWKRRGPGPVGTTSMATITPRVVLYSAKHDPTTIVDRCAVVSALGWGDGTTRERMGIETPGPELCITPAGVFDFPAPARSMRVVHIRPGWSAERLAASTGFDLLGLQSATEVPPPTSVEIQALRERIDIEGALRATEPAPTVRR